MKDKEAREKIKKLEEDNRLLHDQLYIIKSQLYMEKRRKILYNSPYIEYEYKFPIKDAISMIMDHFNLDVVRHWEVPEHFTLEEKKADKEK
jgi:hypothetical protein